MTYIITRQCIKCHRCESICPSGQSLKMSNSIKSMLNAVAIVWVITLYLSVGQPVPRMQAVVQPKYLQLNHLKFSPATTGTTGSLSTIASYPN